MRHRSLWREVAAGIAAVVAAACGSSTPAAPSVPDIVATGPQVFRAGLQSPCAQTSRDFLAMVYTRVTVTRTGNEWVAIASGDPSGDLELRFRQSSSRTLGNTMQVEGTIKGTGIHMPEFIQVLPWNARANFGTDGRTSLSGVAFSAGFLGSPTTGVDGIGSGTVVFSDSSGHSCSGGGFSWSLFPPQTP